MKNYYTTFHPTGFSTVNSYLFTENPEQLIAFLKLAFGATELHRTMGDDNITVGNVILKIGESSFMISQASGQFLGMRTSFYLFVNDVDSVYSSALNNGAQQIFSPADMDYGDRQAGVIDPAGNNWFISQRLSESDY